MDGDMPAAYRQTGRRHTGAVLLTGGVLEDCVVLERTVRELEEWCVRAEQVCGELGAA
jgi:hypothetical protein